MVDAIGWWCPGGGGEDGRSDDGMIALYEAVRTRQMKRGILSKG